MFAIGLVLFIVGLFYTLALGMPRGYGLNSHDYIGVTMFLVGLLMMLTSICILAWRCLP